MRPRDVNIERASQWIDLFLKVASILGGLFVLYQYLESQHQIRVSRTLEYVQKLDDPSSRMGAAYASLSGAMLDVERSVGRYNNAVLSEKRGQELRDRFIRTILERRTSGDRSVASDLNDVVVFHELLQSCIRNNLCDRKTARDFFLSDARKLWMNFANHLEDQRSTNPDFAVGLEQFVSSD